MDLSGKVALVTGGARRVGRAIALELARGGCDVALHYHRSASEAGQVVGEIRALGRRAVAVQGDLEHAGHRSGVVAQTVESLGGLDVLVNNAALFAQGQPDTLENFNDAAWERMFRVNLLAPLALVHHAKTHLAASGAGKVVNLGDSATERPGASHLAYSASKAALVAMTRALARSLAPDVQVNMVAPGIAVFPESYTPELRRKLVARVPLRREGSPDEVARCVRYLVSEGDYITGQVIPIDGGRSVV